MATEVNGGNGRNALKCQLFHGVLLSSLAVLCFFVVGALSVPAWSQETAGTKPGVAAAVKKVSAHKKKAAPSGRRRHAKRSSKARHSNNRKVARKKDAAAVFSYKNSPYKSYGLMKSDVFIYNANGKPVRPVKPREAKKRGKASRRHLKAKVTAENQRAAAKYLAAAPMSPPRKLGAAIKKRRRPARRARRLRRHAATAPAKPYVIPTLDKSRLPPVSRPGPPSNVPAQAPSGAATAQQTAAAKAAAARIVNQALQKSHVPPSALNPPAAQSPAAPQQAPAGASPSAPPTVPVTPP